MGFVGVDFVRNVCEGIWGGASEDSKIGWHDQRDCNVGVAAAGRCSVETGSSLVSNRQKNDFEWTHT